MKKDANYQIINSIKWDIEDRCNLKCKHCMLSNISYKPEKSIIENKMNLKRLIDLGLKQLLFMSKEPFLYNDIEELVRYAHSKGVVTAIITNGTLITYQKIERLLLAGLDSLIISLEGVCSETNDYIRGEGTFEKVEEGLRIIKKVFEDYGTSFRLVLEYTINPQNISESNSLIDYLNKQMFEVVNIGSINAVGEARTNVEIVPKGEDVHTFINRLIEKYKRNSEFRYAIFSKALYPYEIIHMNTYYQTNLTFSTLGCSIRSGEYVLGTDGTLKLCSLLEENQDIKKVAIGKIESMTDEEIKERFRENQKFCNSLLYNCENICKGCVFVKKCFACPAVSDELQIETYEKCYAFRKKFLELLKEKMYSGKWVCSFAESVTVKEEDNYYVRISRHYINNTSNEILVHKGQWVSLFFDKFTLDKANFKENGLKEEDFINMGMNDVLILKRKDMEIND